MLWTTSSSWVGAPVLNTVPDTAKHLQMRAKGRQESRSCYELKASHIDGFR